VIGDTSQSKFPVKKLEPFKAITHLHEFGWETMGAAYGQIMQYAAMNGLKPTGESREIYLNIDFNDPANNRTQIEIGV
jgi:effector-binding domain-containing protein